jgi:hypothetical protein
MSAQPPEPTRGTGDQTGEDAVNLRNKYAERMTHNAKQAPAMKIAVGITVGFVLIVVLVVWIATGGITRLTAKPRAEAPAITQMASVGSPPVHVVTA